MSDPEDSAARDGGDLGRRSFFRHFGRSAVQAVGQVAGAADAFRRGSSAAASELLQIGLGDPDASAARLADAPQGPKGAPPARRVGTTGPSGARAGIPGEASTYRSPFRIVDDTLLVVDRRTLPDPVAEMECREAGDVARAIRASAAHGGPLLAQIAAYGLALTAQRHRSRPIAVQLAELRAAMAIMRRADPSARAMVAALERMAARLDELGEEASSDVVAGVMRAEADALTAEATLDHSALARHGAGLLAQRDDHAAPIEILLHGPLGPMSAGTVGTGLGIIQLLAAEGRPLRIWVTEGRPTLDGTRVTSWELDQMSLAYSVLPDSAVQWLLDREAIDAVLLAADWVAANGDAACAIGSGAIAALAGAVDPSVPVYLCAPTSCFGLDARDAEAIPRSALARPSARSGPAAPARTVLAPTMDIVRARHVSAIVTEEGVLRPPFATALAAAVETRERRRAAPPPVAAEQPWASQAGSKA